MCKIAQLKQFSRCKSAHKYVLIYFTPEVEEVSDRGTGSSKIQEVKNSVLWNATSHFLNYSFKGGSQWGGGFYG